MCKIKKELLRGTSEVDWGEKGLADRAERERETGTGRQGGVHDSIRLGRESCRTPSLSQPSNSAVQPFTGSNRPEPVAGSPK